MSNLSLTFKPKRQKQTSSPSNPPFKKMISPIACKQGKKKD